MKHMSMVSIHCSQYELNAVSQTFHIHPWKQPIPFHHVRQVRKQPGISLDRSRERQIKIR